MGNDFIYVPVLQSKNGEINAVKRLTDTIKLNIKPLFELHRQAPDAKTSPCDHIDKVAKKLSKSFGNMPMFYDLCTYCGGYFNGIAAWEYASHKFQELGLNITPVFDTNQSSLSGELPSVVNNSEYLCLRINVQSGLDSAIADIAGYNNLVERSLEKTSLFLDFRGIYGATNLQANSLRDSALNLLANIPSIERWESIILASSAFPPNLGEISPHQEMRRDRKDWQLWQRIRNRQPMRVPIYSDYAISDPSPIPLVGPVNTPVSLRYTLDDEWWMLKGGVVKRDGSDSFQRICTDVVNSDQFYGSSYSWGDEEIYRCHQTAEDLGGSQKWREIGFNHHISVVVNQQLGLE